VEACLKIASTNPTNLVNPDVLLLYNLTIGKLKTDYLNHSSTISNTIRQPNSRNSLLNIVADIVSSGTVRDPSIRNQRHRTAYKRNGSCLDASAAS
jgi:hypothetical protein